MEDARLREAVDPDFNTKKSSESEKNAKKDRSLRRDKAKNSFDESELVPGSGLSVTKGFKEHVAKKLSESLEK